jgi:membrane protein
MTNFVRELGRLLTAIFWEWRNDNVQRLAAAIAYYTVFAISPLLIIVIAVAGRFFGAEAVRGQIVAQFGALIGTGAAQQIETMIRNASNPSSNLLATGIGIVALLLGAAGLFGQLKGALDAIWKPPSRPATLWLFLRRYLISVAMVMGLAFLLLVSLVFSAAVSGLATWAGTLVKYSTVTALQWADLVVSFVAITILFAMIYKILPEVRICWADVWVGAAVTSVLFNMGKHLIGLYLGRSSLSSVFGAAGSLGILLVWTYYSASIFLIGAEFTKVYSKMHGSRSLRAMSRRQARFEHDLQRRSVGAR